MYNWIWNGLSKLHSSEYVSKCETLYEIVYGGEIGTECVIEYQIECVTA